ncbi:putative lipid II flippase FtsW [Alkalihalobacillus sp. AL-G]|uniref:putative lipid II flippase FtsW n=1 Tax=Alkalihalobacillus sp. AL-G TaxID=2926399 RepID=UPI00272D0A6C|nr:putative lipid II flippase FtsW [Alkalihalobacillus sp. AL-G]WLD95025.1 putative lipid II flippase FtsW [Alkalihalobacillus sp. AL-G]
MLKRMFKNYDYTLIAAVLILTAIGLVMVYSSSMIVAVTVYHEESTHFFNKHLIWVTLGIFTFLFFMVVPYKMYQRLIIPITVVMLVLLGLVPLIGEEHNGARSWFEFGPVSLQPAEFAKIGVILYLASVFSKKQHYLSDFKTGVIPPLTMLAIVCFLIVLQPDFGTMMIIVMTSAVIVFCSGMRWKHLFMMVGSMGGLGLIVYKFFLNSEQLSRFTGAYQPFSDPQQDGYHLINGYLALGTGGLFGNGLGQSIQKYGFLPEPHTDFIIAIIGEELGFAGVLVIILLLYFIVFKGIYIGLHCKDAFGSLLSIGIAGMIGIQAFVNLGAASGLLPITGVTLPFISYGGSSLILLMISMGILVNVSMFVRYRKEQTPPADQAEPESNKQTKLRVVSRHQATH